MLKNDAFQDETSTDEKAKRYLYNTEYRNAKITFYRLKSKFIRLAESTGAYSPYWRQGKDVSRSSGTKNAKHENCVFISNIMK